MHTFPNQTDTNKKFCLHWNTEMIKILYWMQELRKCPLTTAVSSESLSSFWWRNNRCNSFKEWPTEVYDACQNTCIHCFPPSRRNLMAVNMSGCTSIIRLPATVPSTLPVSVNEFCLWGSATQQTIPQSPLNTGRQIDAFIVGPLVHHHVWTSIQRPN